MNNEEKAIRGQAREKRSRELLWRAASPGNSRWILRCCVIGAGATFCCSGLARWQRLQVLDLSCRTIRSVAWVCIET